MLEIRFFGQPRFVYNGAPFHLAVPPKALEILACLLLHRGSGISRDALSFTIWPDESEDEARARLRKYLYRLTKAVPLGDRWILAEGGTLRCQECDGLTLDVWSFDDAFAAGRYDDAIARYEGELLEGFYSDWVLESRERYRSRFFAALEDSLLAARRSRDLTAAQRYAQRILSADPWREHVVRGLMTIRFESGDRAGALQVFDEFAQRAREEMDVTPMSDTIALRDAILRGRLPAQSEPVADEPRIAGGFALVGRNQELQDLRRMWERAARGHGGSVIISGEPGIGKSRIARELALLAEAEGGRVLWGTTSPEESRPYQAIVESIEQAVPHLSEATPERLWLDVLGTLVPALREGAGAVAPPSIAPEREQHRLIESVTRALQAVARSRPTILVLEDMQWATNATALAIERILACAVESPLLVVLTHRDDGIALTPFGRIRGRLGGASSPHVIALGPLPRAAIRELLYEARAQTPSDEFAEAVEKASEGNPLLILSSALAKDASAVPAARAAMLLQRFDALSDDARHFAEYAAVAGSRFGFDLLREAAACSEHDAFEALDHLQDARIIEERPRAGAFEFRFTHELLRRALYERIDDRIRRRRHGRIARVLERLYATDAAAAGELALHYDRAGDRERAAPHFVRAAEYAASVFAHAEAQRFARRALEIGVLKPSQRHSALWVLCESSWRLGELFVVRDALSQLEEDAESTVEERCRILFRRSELEFAAGDRAARLTAINHLSNIAAANTLPQWLTRAHVEGIHSDLYAGVEGSLHAAQTELERLNGTTDASTVVRLLSVCCTAAAADLSGDAAQRYSLRAQSVAEDSGDPLLRSIALRTALSVAHHRQDYPRIAELANDMIALARSTGDTLAEAIGYAYLANASYGMGKVSATSAAYAEALGRLERAGDRANLMRATLNCAVFECEEGLLESSREHAGAAERIARDANDPSIEHHATLVLATIENESGNHAKARAILDRLLAGSDLDPQTKTGVLEESGRAAMGLNDYSRAIADLDAACHGFDELGQRWYARRARAELALAHSLARHTARARALAAELRAEDTQSQPLVFAKRVDAALAQLSVGV